MFHSTNGTTFAPKPEVALRVYCVAVRSAILATAWLLVKHTPKLIQSSINYC